MIANILWSIFLPLFVLAQQELTDDGYVPAVNEKDLQIAMRMFKLIDIPAFNEKLNLAGIAKNALPQLPNVEQFEWRSVSAARTGFKERTLVVIGGALAGESDTKPEKIVNSASGVVACTLQRTTSNYLGFEIVQCEQMRFKQTKFVKGNTHVSWGFTTAVGVSDGNTYWIGYCDPLTCKDEYRAFGVCELVQYQRNKRLYVVNNGPLTENRYGYSLAMRPNVSKTVLVGSMNTNDPSVTYSLDARQETMVKSQQIKGEYVSFGQSVAFSNLPSGVNDPAIFYISSPLEGKVFEYEGMGNRITLRGNLAPEKSPFGSYGHAIETLLVRGQVEQSILLASAPFDGSDGIINRGAVYMFCPGSSEPRKILGNETGGYFGYAVKTLGDLDGNGIDDFAVSAPALSNNQGKVGKVFIFKVLPHCDYKIAQVIEPLKPAKQNHQGGFGVSISKGVDVNYDGLIELIVTSLAHEPALMIFTIQKSMQAKCRIPRHIIRTGTENEVILSLQIQVQLSSEGSKEIMSQPQSGGYYLQQSKFLHQLKIDGLYFDRMSHFNKTLPNAKSSYQAFFYDPEIVVHDELRASRFKLIGDIEVFQDMVSLTVKYTGTSLDLRRIPLEIAFRSLNIDQDCGTINPKCSQKTNLNVDWSQCKVFVYEGFSSKENNDTKKNIQMAFKQDLTEVTSEKYVKPLTSDDGTIYSVMKFGVPNMAQRVFNFSIVNLGQEIIDNLRVEVYTLGSYKLKNDAAVKLNIEDVIVTSEGGTKNVCYPGSDYWTLKFSFEKDAVLLKSGVVMYLYPGEVFVTSVSVNIEGLSDMEALVNAPEDVDMSLHVKVYSVTDANATAHSQSIRFKYDFTPNLQITSEAVETHYLDDRTDTLSYADMKEDGKVFSNDLGPPISSSFSIHNREKYEVNNLTYSLEIPYATLDGDILVYLSDKIRANNKMVSALPVVHDSAGNVISTCEIQNDTSTGHPNAPDFLNPGGFVIMDSSQQGQRDLPQSLRQRRSVESYPENETPPQGIEPTSLRSTSGRSKRQRKFYIMCPPNRQFDYDPDGSSSKINIACARFTCRVAKIPAKDKLKVNWRGWVFAPTIFKLLRSDVEVRSTLHLVSFGQAGKSNSIVDFNTPSEKFMVRYAVFFNRIVEPAHSTPIWPIVVGIVAGCMFLASVISILYLCGFFRRRQMFKRALRRIAEAEQARKAAMVSADRDLVPRHLFQTIHENEVPSDSHLLDPAKGEFMYEASPSMLKAPGLEPPSADGNHPEPWDDYPQIAYSNVDADNTSTYSLDTKITENTPSPDLKHTSPRT